MPLFNSLGLASRQRHQTRLGYAVNRFVVFCFSQFSSQFRDVKSQLEFCTILHEMILTKKFTDQQAKFIRYAADGMDLEQAAVASGYAPASALDAGGQLRRQPAIIAAIQIEVAKRLAFGSARSLRVLEEIRDDPTTDKRLRAAISKDLLTRAGHIGPKAVAAGAAGDTPLNEMTMDELRERAERLEGEIAARAKDVSSAKPAPKASQVVDDII